MIKYLLTTTFLFISVFVLAQTNIKGRVTSADDGHPIPFVNIIGLKSNAGTTTDLSGSFKLSVPEKESHLIFSVLGFLQDTIAINSQTMKVQLKPVTRQLDEVVVTALGIEREKKSIGYAITEVDGDELKHGNEVSVINKLSGKVAGLQITSTNGGAGSSSRITLRGNNSITGDNQALIVVDGVPINNSTTSNSGGEWGGRDYGNGVSDINPEDIETISVLKGASASALYGSQAMDGVILITTKKGKSKKGIGLNFSTNTSVDMPYILYDLQNTYGAGRNGQFEGAWDIIDGTPTYNTGYDLGKGSWGPKMEGQTIIDWDGEERAFLPQPDNYKNYFDYGMTYKNSIGIDGGNDKFTYRLSVSDLRSSDINPESSINRLNTSLKLSGNISKKIKVASYFNYSRQKAENRPGLSDAHDNPNRNYIHMPRHISTESLENKVMDSNNNETTWYHNWSWMTNPFRTPELHQNEDIRNRFFGNASVTFQFSERFSMMFRVAPDISRTDYDEQYAIGGLINADGHYSINTINQDLINSDFLATYNNKITRDLTYNFNIGGNQMYFKSNQKTAYTSGGLVVPGVFSLNNSVNPIYSRKTKSEAAKNSVYAFGKLAYKGFLYFDITGRNDWSSTLPIDNNSFFYPSFSLGLVYSELIEKDFISKDFLSFGKFRISYAGVGNDADPYQLETTYEYIDNEGYGDMAFIDRTIPNFGLLPELVNSFEIGSDMKFFMNRIGLDITYYDTRSHNQITYMPVAFTSGYDNAIVNSGIIQNKGLEVHLNTTPIKSASAQWDINFAFSNNKSEVLELADNVERVTLYEHWRLTIEARPDRPYGDIVGYGFLRDDNDNILVDEYGMAIRDDTPKVLGNFTPDFSLSISNNIKFKNFTLRTLVHARMGGEMFAGTNMYGYGYSGNFKETLKGREEWYASEAAREDAGVSSEDWTPTGGLLIGAVYEDGTIINDEDVSGQANETYVDPYQYYKKVSKWTEEIHEPFVYDASFVKLREVSLTYQLPDNILKKLKLKGASVGVYGKNLWLIYSKIPNMDPETMLTNGNGQGYELYSYPNTRSIGFSLNVNI